LNKRPDEKYYLLYHYYEHGENNEYEEIKMLGIYSSEEKASEAIERYFKLNGFKKHPKDCFEIQECNVDVDASWTEGFANSEEIEEEFEILTNCFNDWLNIYTSPKESWENERFYNALCDVYQKAYKINDIGELARCIQDIWLTRLNDNSKNLDDYITLATNIKGCLRL